MELRVYQGKIMVAGAPNWTADNQADFFFCLCSAFLAVYDNGKQLDRL